MTFTEYVDPIRWWARLTPEKTAIVDRANGMRTSYAALDHAASHWAALFASRGIRPLDRVAALASNRVEMVALFYGCGRVGAALVPLNWRLSSSELSRVLVDAQPTLLVGEERFSGSHHALGADLPWLDLGREAPAALAASAPEVTSSGIVQLEHPAMILYTSGSTGAPKGVIISHRQILFNAVATTTAWQLTGTDCGPVSTPFFHTGGWHVFATPLWSQGGTVVLFEAFDPDTFLDGLATEGCTIAFGVPTQFVMMIERASWGRPLPSLRWFISGGAPCPRSLADRIRSSGYQMKEGFGMTECGPNCFAIADEMAVDKPGSVGWPVPFLETRLVDEHGGDVSDETVGELLLRGPQLFSGYLHAADRTAEVMTAEGWLKTGDLASRDGDGAYTIRGRRKDMFISGGENVYPGEVEAALVGCDGVGEAVVVGVSHARWGEVGHAFIQPRAGAHPEPDALIGRLRATLAHYKVPKAFEIVGELPRIGSGKIDRAALRILAAEHTR